MQLTWQGCSMETRKSWVQSLPSTMSYVYDSQGPMDKTLSPFKLVWISWVPYFSVRVLRSSQAGDRYCWMPLPLYRNSTMFGHPPHIWGQVFQSTRRLFPLAFNVLVGSTLPPVANQQPDIVSNPAMEQSRGSRNFRSAQSLQRPKQNMQPRPTRQQKLYGSVGQRTRFDKSTPTRLQLSTSIVKVVLLCQKT